MMRTCPIVSLIMAGCFCLSAHAEEKLVEASWSLPISFGRQFENEALPHGMKEREAVQVLGMPMKAYDMRGWFESQGVKIPADGLAIYLLDANALLLKTSEEGMKAFEDAEAKRGKARWITTATEFYLVSCRLPEAIGEKQMTYKQLRAAAGDSWTVVSAVSCMVRSGLRGTASDDKGATLDAEVVVGPDNTAIDVMYLYSFKGSGSDGAPLELKTLSATTTESGVFNILQMAGPSGKGGFTYALVMRSSVLLPGNVALPSVEKLPTEK